MKRIRLSEMINKTVKGIKTNIEGEIGIVFDDGTYCYLTPVYKDYEDYIELDISDEETKAPYTIKEIEHAHRMEEDNKDRTT